MTVQELLNVLTLDGLSCISILNDKKKYSQTIDLEGVDTYKRRAIVSFKVGRRKVKNVEFKYHVESCSPYSHSWLNIWSE